MAQREVRVVINGKETVSTATNQADGAMGGFTSKIPGWAKTVGLLAAAYEIVTGAISRARDFVVDAVAAYDRFASSQTKLAAQSKLTGVSMAELNRLAEEGRTTFGLSTVVANDAATTVAKYASRAGDAAQANRLFAAALDLGAASGLNAAETMEALEQGLRGQDEGFDKLLGKNPSALWKEYADANGLAVGKMSDTQKRMAELTAIVEAGNVVQGAYNDRVESGAGSQDRLNNAMEDGKVSFGQAIQPARILANDVLVGLAEIMGRVTLAIARVVNAITVAWVGGFRLAQSAVGALVGGIAKLTGNKELAAWAAEQTAQFPRFVEQMDKLEKKYLTTGTASTDSATKQEQAGSKVRETVTKTAETVEQQSARLNRALDQKLGEPLRVVIGMTEGAITRLGQAAAQQLPTGQSERFLTHMQGLAAKAEESRLKMIGTADATEKGARSSGDLARDVAGVARAALDAASAFGVVDDNAARSLNSAINIGNSLANIAKSGFTFAGVTGVIGGVASLVNSMMAGDAERKRLLSQNNVQLERLRNEIGNLNLNVTGEDLGKAQNAISQFIDESTRNPRALKTPQLVAALRANGLNIEDLKRIAKELGIEIVNSRGELVLSALPQLLAAIQASEPGQFGQSFGDQLNATTSGFGVRGTNAVGQIAALGNLGGQFSSALRGIVDVNDLSGTRTRLAALFERLNNGGVSASELGGLTGSQFLDLITDLIGRIDNLQPSGGGGGTVTVPDTVGGGGSTPPVPTETIQAVIKAMDNNIASILTVHTTLHERIAVATESSATSLQSIDAKMDTLIAVSSGSDRLDQALEETRFALAVQQGAGVSF